MQIWFLIGEQTRKELKKFLPSGWEPPRHDSKPVSLDCQIEGPEEIGKIMRQLGKRRRAGA